MKIALRVLLVLLGGFVVWRILASGIADHYAARIAEGDRGAVQKALAWAPHHPQAVLADAIELIETDPVSAKARLKDAYRYDPTNPRPLVLLARLAYVDGELDEADALMDSAVRLGPADPSILNETAAYWAMRGELEKGVSYWSRVLEADPGRGRQIFPVLMELVEDPRTLPVVRPLALSPPSWWDSFFAEVAQRALDVETVRSLYGLRREAIGAPPTADERAAYVSRLQRDGLVTEAYLIWVNGLAPDERRYLGLLYDGGFELEPSQSGFGWIAPRTSQVEMRIAATYGTQGSRALHVRFANRERPFRHLFQRLYLDPGNYRVYGKVRPEGLDTLGGLRWQVNCLLTDSAQESTPLGESERFLGAGDWRSFSFDFVVPQGCVFQEIRLVSSGRRAFEHKMNGVVWFDALGIRKVEEVSAAARIGVSAGDAPMPAPVDDEERPSAGDDLESGADQDGANLAGSAGEG
ncbi:tetratricopeptide repeat protein [Thiococcus pfennigii]|uniref:tetratricopeptide repeat protein n=1 Tax=Thiococcus pfennigii TaxID=1057 RepID=UPI0019040735|nr:tetratricopeptide repeat protein [Thiococcus pfennigii]